MEFGDLLLKLGLFTAVVASILLFGSARERRLAALADVLAGVHVLALVAAFAWLCALFVGRHYEYVYVSQYSSRALSPAMALAASWAGQEGSFLLWATLAGLVGVALWRQPGPLTRPALAFVGLGQVFLMVLLAFRSPFARFAVTPADGQGLNPLLQDPWMVIHPPVLFLGYAALIVPFALGAALLAGHGDARAWTRATWPWALFGVVTLGAGIALGGVWAYKVLGWGGYWGWDPVENASLVPWLVAVALLHGLLIQRTTGALLRTNLVLAAAGWLAVLGGTYLTRSGILQDFSVHSFTDLGLNAPLMMFLVTNALLTVALLVWRWRGLDPTPRPWVTLSRESGLWIGLATVLILGALVAIGTLAPVLTAIGGKASNVSTEYYKLVSVPVGVAIVLLMALAPVLTWSRQRGHAWVGALVPGLVAGAALPVIAAAAGVRDRGTLALLVVSGLALGVNTGVALKLFRRGWTYGAGYLVHVGIAVMVLGMVMSSALGRSERVRLVQGRTIQSLGFTLELAGVESPGPRRRVLDIQVHRGDWTLAARPMLIDMPRQEGMVRKPAIDGRRDFYLSPMELVESPAGAIAVVEVSTKPFVNLVWIGALIALLGTAMAGLRRAIEWLPGRSAARDARRAAAATAREA